jgi:hypothetical protein
MIMSTKAILESNNAPSSVIAELNHYLAVAQAGLEQKPLEESSTTAAASDAVHFGVSGNLPVHNIFDTLTAEQVVHSDRDFHDFVQSSQSTDSPVLTGIDKSVILDSANQIHSSDAVETTDLDLVADEPEPAPVLKEAEAESAKKKQPTKDRQPQDQNQDPARIQEQAEQVEQARSKRKQIARKILSKLPFKNLRILRRTSPTDSRKNEETPKSDASKEKERRK